jgi:hypothetical protein
VGKNNFAIAKSDEKWTATFSGYNFLGVVSKKSMYVGASSLALGDTLHMCVHSALHKFLNRFMK